MTAAAVPVATAAKARNSRSRSILSETEIEKLRRLLDNEQPMESPLTKRRSWLRPRFSLHVLLLAFTAFAIGFPVWYRWPYEETKQLPPPFKAGAKTIDEKRVTTWRRQWGGGRLKHGPTQQAIEGQAYLITTYQNGLKHGPYLNYRFDILPDGNGLKVVRTKAPYTIGQYAEDEKDGVWTEIVDGQKQTTTWDHGKQVR